MKQLLRNTEIRLPIVNQCFTMKCGAKRRTFGQCVLVKLQGFFCVAFHQKSCRKVRLGHSQIRVEQQGLLKGGFGSFELHFSVVHLSFEEIDIRVLGLVLLS